MTIDRASDDYGPSTTWEWRKVKIKSASPRREQRAKRSSKASEPPIRRRETFTLVVQYSGGPESSWVIRRGSRFLRAPGHMAVEDLMVRLGVSDL